MELNSNHLLVFDACSIINLFYIDYEHEVIFKNLNEYFDLYFPEKVRKEIKDNRFNKADKLKEEKRISLTHYEDLKDFIDSKFGELYDKVIYNYYLKETYSQDYFDDISKIVGFRNNEGEWYCFALSLFLSRYKQMRLSLITDDFPAKEEYVKLVQDQQIGLIEDTADILFLMYWNCPDIDKNRLKKILQDLYSEYHLDLKDLLKVIRKFRINKINPKDKGLNWAILKFEDKLENLELDELGTLRDEIIKESGQLKKGLKQLFDTYPKVFEVSSNKNLLNKIRYKLEFLEKRSIFKMF